MRVEGPNRRTRRAGRKVRAVWLDQEASLIRPVRTAIRCDIFLEFCLLCSLNTAAPQ